VVDVLPARPSPEFVWVRFVDIRWDIATNGMKVIGLDHVTRELAGLHRIRTAGSSFWVLEKERPDAPGRDK
jgi:hypothetical protein